MASQSHSGDAPASRKLPTRFIAIGVTLLVLIGLALYLLGSSGTGDQRTIDQRSTTSDNPPATKTSSTGVLESGGTRLLPIPDGALKDFVGKPVTGRAVPVQTSFPEAGFWIGNSDAQRVYVAYSGQAPESGFRVDLEGQVKAVPDNVAKALSVRHDDVQQLRSQGGYIEAKTVKQVGKAIGTVPKGP